MIFFYFNYINNIYDNSVNFYYNLHYIYNIYENLVNYCCYINN